MLWTDKQVLFDSFKMFFLIDPLENANWGKEFTPSMYICCFRLMICLLKTPLHLQARCFFSHQCQKSNSSESSQTWGFWHPSYPGNKNIKTIFFFLWKQKCFYFLQNSALETQEASPSSIQQNNVFTSFLNLNVFGWRKKEKRIKKITVNIFSIILLLQENDSGEV